MYYELVDELFERLPALAVLTGFERDRQKEEAQRIVEDLGFSDRDDFEPGGGEEDEDPAE